MRGRTKGPRVMVTCETCGRQFEVLPHLSKGPRRRRFCDRDCYYQSPSPKWRGGITHDGRGYPQFSSGPHKGRRVHEVVAEMKLGRPLRTGEVVHHIDGDVTNNEPDNIKVFPSQSDHMKHHSQQKRG